MAEELSVYQRDLDRFTFSCDRLIEANFVSCDPRIADVLRSITESPLLYAFMHEITKNYDFERELLKARVPATLDGHKLLLPEDSQQFIAFSFFLLVYIDFGKIKLSDFLADYFFDLEAGFTGAFKKFCESVIQKFKRAVLAIICDGPDKTEAAESETRAAKTEIVVADEVAASDAVEGIRDIVAGFIQISSKSEQLSTKQKDEIMVVSDCFATCLDGGNKKQIYALFLGLKYTVNHFIGNCADRLESIFNLLNKNFLI